MSSVSDKVLPPFRDSASVLTFSSFFQQHSHWQDVLGPPQQRTAFYIFRQREFSIFALLLLFALLVVTVSIIMRRVMYTYPHTYLTIPLVVHLVATLVVSCGFVMRKIWACWIKFSSDGNALLNVGVQQYYHTNVTYFLVILCLPLFVWQLVILRKEYDYVTEQMPPRDTLPDGLTVLGALLPTIFYSVFKCVPFTVAIVTVNIQVITNVALIAKFGLHQSMVLTALGYGFSMFLLAEYHRQCWHSFQINVALQSTLTENSRLAEEIKANELRHMIGNVAHELKTPLSSFVSGIDVIQHIASELQRGMEIRHDAMDSDSYCHKALQGISTILEVAENVTTTNTFMIMTIDRCIDYNKTLFGVKLSPKLEVFMLKDSIDFVSSCVKTVSDRVCVEWEYGEGVLQKGKMMMKTDKYWFQENLLCLVGNAVKYSLANTTVRVLLGVETKCLEVAPVCIDLESQASNNCNPTKLFLRITVEDTGPGIAKEFRNKLFAEPAQTARLNGGTGLGLYSMAKRVEALGGEYGILNRSDGRSGCQFWFTIPLIGFGNEDDANSYRRTTNQLVNAVSDLKGFERENATNFLSVRESDLEPISPKRSVRRPKSNPHSYRSVASGRIVSDMDDPKLVEVPICTISQLVSSKALHVLLVDDSPAIVKMTSLALKKQGFVVSTAQNGQEAVELFREILMVAPGDRPQVDVVLMDFQMPVMNGLKAIHEIRLLESNYNASHKNESPRQSIIVGFSAKSDEDQIEEAYLLGMDAFLPKPFLATSFRNILAWYLANHAPK